MVPPPPPPPLPGHVEYPHPPHFVETSSDPITKILNVTNAFTLWMLGAVAMSALMFANGYVLLRSSLSQHIYLCVIGYIILMSLAVTSISPFSSLSRSYNQNEKRILHGVLQVTGSILAIAGCIIRIINMDNHFNSAHGICGIIAMILTFLSLIGGILNMYSQKFNLNPVLIKTCHSCLGCLTLVIAFLCLIFGFSHNLYRLSLGDNNANMCIAFTVIAIVGVLLSPTITLYNRVFKS